MNNIVIEKQIKKVGTWLKESCKIARDTWIQLENEIHHDFYTEELLANIEDVSSSKRGVNYDTEKIYRYRENPIRAERKLYPYIFATNLKVIAPVCSRNTRDWTYYATVPVGYGILDNSWVIAAFNQESYDGFCHLTGLSSS